MDAAFTLPPPNPYAIKYPKPAASPPRDAARHVRHPLRGPARGGGLRHNLAAGMGCVRVSFLHISMDIYLYIYIYVPTTPNEPHSSIHTYKNDKNKQGVVAVIPRPPPAAASASSSSLSAPSGGAAPQPPPLCLVMDGMQVCIFMYMQSNDPKGAAAPNQPYQATQHLHIHIINHNKNRTQATSAPSSAPPSPAACQRRVLSCCMLHCIACVYCLGMKFDWCMLHFPPPMVSRPPQSSEPHLSTPLHTHIHTYKNQQVMIVQGCDPWSPKALRSGMGATFKAPSVSEAAGWQGASSESYWCRCLCLCVSELCALLPQTHIEAKAALAARHGAALQFVAADGGEGLADYDAIDWTGGFYIGVG